ncbi:MAG TPA: MbcA/ParS/Xre antitoxin family protein [Pyrinomonadaceae bacterium]|jgi:uncharacterized protein (DUF2384 family)
MAQQLYNPPTERELLEDINSVFSDDLNDPIEPAWLETPNDQLGGKKPRDLIKSGTEGRLQVRNLLDAIKLGMPT